MNKLGTTLSIALAITACSSSQGTGDPGSATATEATSITAGARSITADAHPHDRIAQEVMQTDLVSDQPGAAHQDPNLVNAWGLAFNPTAGFPWVSDNHTGKATVYDATGALKLTVTVPPPPGADVSAPTGQAFNGDAASFAGDKFIFVTEDGTISGWQPGAGTTLRYDASASGAVYKGMALATHRGAARLYAANFHAGTVDVLDASYTPVARRHRAFTDDDLPAGYAPFNVYAAGRVLLVSYALQDAAAHDDTKGPGHGFIDAFDTEGRFLLRLVSRGALNSPWGMAFAPDSFGRVGGRLLVGNFGDGRINAYEIERSWCGLRAEHEGALGDGAGQPLVIDGLWAIGFAPEVGGFHANQLYFTAGPAGESHGLFGRLEASASLQGD